MRNIISQTLIAVLLILPTAASAQRTKTAGAQRKAARLTMNVEFTAKFTSEINRKRDNGYETVGNAKSEFVTKYQFTQAMTALKHDGFLSLIEPGEPSTSGSFTYEQSSHIEEHHPKEYGGDSVTEEKNSYLGTIAHVGTSSVDTADQGEDLTSMQTSAAAEMSGSSVTTVQDSHGKKVDGGCTGGYTSITYFTVNDPTPVPNAPPDKNCGAKGEFSASIHRITGDGGMLNQALCEWNGFGSSGSFAAGAINFSFKRACSPPLRQTDENGEKQTYNEELIVNGVVTFAAGSVKPSVALTMWPSHDDLTTLLPRFLQLRVI